jgi:hypothetical protein
LDQAFFYSRSDESKYGRSLHFSGYRPDFQVSLLCMRPNQRCGAGAGTTTIVSPPVLPCSPVAPVEPVAPVAPFSAGMPCAPVAPCGPAGPGTFTAAGGGATTVVGLSHALNASADRAIAATTIEYLMMILLVAS